MALPAVMADLASARLSRKLEFALPAFLGAGGRLLEHPRARELYPAFQAASVYVSMMFVPLMEAALERCRTLAPGDPVAAGLIDYLERHIPEEMHGDEPGGGLVDDLRAVGVDTEALRTAPLPPQMAALIGTVAFRVRHAHPVAILGFLYLETYQPDPASVETLIERTGLPRDGFRQLLVHAEIEARHSAEMRAVLDSLPLEPWHEQLVGLTALETMGALAEAWFDVLDGRSQVRTGDLLLVRTAVGTRGMART